MSYVRKNGSAFENGFILHRLKCWAGQGRMGYKRLLRQPMWKIYKKRGVAAQRWRRSNLEGSILREKIEKKSRGIGV